MGEVMEISIVCNKDINIDLLLGFIAKQMKEVVDKRTIEIMDNWLYENLFLCIDEKEIRKYINDKIILLTEERTSSFSGIHIEHIEDGYQYTIWFKCVEVPLDDIYNKIENEFIKFMKESEWYKDIKICAIGKETVFEYQNDLQEIILKSHNIHTWVINTNFYIESERIFADSAIFEKQKISNNISVFS